MLRKRRAELARFENRLSRTWGRPLDLLETLTVIAIESGDMMSRVWPWRQATDRDLVFDIVRRLQARGCQVA